MYVIHQVKNKIKANPKIYLLNEWKNGGVFMWGQRDINGNYACVSQNMILRPPVL